MRQQPLLDLSVAPLITSGIYVIKKDGVVVYVGHSAEIPVRLKRHKSRLRKGEHSNPHLQNAWNLYGEAAFEFTVLEECPVELLVEREQSHMDCYTDLYNILPASGSRLGTPHTDEVRAKIGAAARGRGHTLSPEARAKIGEANRRRVVSDETKAKTSASLKGRKVSPEERERMSASRRGHEVRPETKEKISASLKGRTVSPEALANMKTAQRARRKRGQAEQVMTHRYEEERLVLSGL